MMIELPLFVRARTRGNAIAFKANGISYSYQDMLDKSEQLALVLLDEEADLCESRVALLVSPGGEYAASQWGIWRAGGIVVPLCLSATEAEWEYALTDSGATIVVADEPMFSKIESLCERLKIRLVSTEQNINTANKSLPIVSLERKAMILYTSGTTSKPKGVVTTHANIQAQIESLVEAWEWSCEDRIPLFLPMHHIHGIINVLGCALWSGAIIEPFDRFDMKGVLDRVCGDAYTIFMAVPTIYVKLIQAIEIATQDERTAIVDGFSRMRLMVSGSAALPATVHERWTSLTGQKLLERYGMTEIGMAISNPYRGERRPGAIGKPLPNVKVRLQNDSGVTIEEENEVGEIQIRGPGVFQAYWGRPEMNAEVFQDGWFRTGDMAVLENGYYRILGRSSVDIIKSGGYKLSALEIESCLLDHPDILECAVVGLPDETWGEIVSAAVVIRPGGVVELASLRDWCKKRMSVYKVPQRLLSVQSLPRNAMGKVTKPTVRVMFGDN